MKIETFTKPFRHWLVHDLLSPALLLQLQNEIPSSEWGGWVRYNNSLEMGKRTCNQVHILGGVISYIFNWLNGNETVDWLRKLSGIEDLAADPTLHGAGVHITDPNGYLQPHLDYNLHPFSKKERRLNLVLFANSKWEIDWGGAFELWNDSATECVERFYPQFNTAVIWESSEIAYHGTQRVTADAPSRITVATYYLTPARPTALRKRALFVPQRV